MAMTEAAAQPHDQPGRLGRRRPFSALMKKLANLKGVSSGDGGRYSGSKRSGAKKPPNNPYPQSGRIPVGNSSRHSHYSVSTGPSRRLTSTTSLDRSESLRLSNDEQPPPTTGGRSMAPTVSTEHGTCRSILAPSHVESSLAGTSRTATGRRGGDSTFSSPAPSVRSLTTTLTTIQTVAPNTGGNTHNSHHNNNHTTTNQHSQHSNSQVIHFNQPFPTTSPASAIPAHLSINPATFNPTTYATATANNLLTDNASILTLASSSQRRRRRSFDTDASVRAMAPSSLWGGSRESLPLSVLSATMDGTPATPGLHRGTSAGVAGLGAMGANERTSIYSATGILGTAAVASERNSFYAKQGFGGDATSVRSGFLGHGRADSVSGSISGLGVPPTGTSPLVSPREVSVEREIAEKGDEEEKEGRA
ncbi:hypothetical protein C8A00DRAFT_16673 [Chaetomidium leptoderma]|uniref:Uncharacterized protein n=1 Tax=Chaetomidium leptoderma TaxID=669021 RepID=A0AAN6ZV19_9PEZI|nr:hypothetical protein C8A00DRAFT_16673 [Chaetomidium leptoderma]